MGLLQAQAELFRRRSSGESRERRKEGEVVVYSTAVSGVAESSQVFGEVEGGFGWVEGVSRIIADAPKPLSLTTRHSAA